MDEPNEETTTAHRHEDTVSGRSSTSKLSATMNTVRHTPPPPKQFRSTDVRVLSR